MTDLLKPKGTLKVIPLLKSSNFLDNEGILFIVEGEDYHFKLSVDQSGLYVHRNGEQCALHKDMLHNGHLTFFILIWNPSKIELITAERLKSETGADVDREINSLKNTLPCAVPLSLKRWAREQSLIPTVQYNSENEFRDTIYQCLANLKSNVEDNAIEAFWDYTYSGNKIAGKKPKKEPLAQPTIKGLIQTELILKGIDVFRENVTPAGDIDFTLVGTVKRIGLVNMCVELKNAHSQYLENGLINQLPDYMRSQDSQYGAYVVLNYNLKDGTNLQRADLTHKLNLLQLNSTDSLVQHNIRTFVIDLDKNVVASKKK